MSEKELKQLAIDIVEGKVFGSWNITDADMLPMVFMVITFMDFDKIQELQDDDIWHFYEYLDKAGPRSINGMPIFFSAHTITKDDWKKVIPLIKEFQSKKEQFMESAHA